MRPKTTLVMQKAPKTGHPGPPSKGGWGDVLLLFFFSLALICCAGCVGGDTISNHVVVPDLGLGMYLPSNWYVDHDEPRMYMEAGKTDDNFGMVEDYPLEGMTLDAYVKDALENSIDAELLSSESAIISGQSAYISVSRGRYTIMEANIEQDGQVIRVWFRALPADFDRQKDAFKAALEGIRMK